MFLYLFNVHLVNYINVPILTWFSTHVTHHMNSVLSAVVAAD